MQRVGEARVSVAGEPVGAIGRGVCILLGVSVDDREEHADALATKIARLRIFENEHGKLDRSVRDVDGMALVVSQFTLLADSKRQRGTRPSFTDAAPASQAEPIYEHFCQALRELGVHVETGVFGATMQLELVNDGPVTIILEV